MDASEPQTEHSAFICGVNSKREANVSVGNRNTTPKRFSLSFFYTFDISTAPSGKCRPLVVKPGLLSFTCVHLAVSQTLTSDSPIWPRSWKLLKHLYCIQFLLLWHFNLHQ